MNFGESFRRVDRVVALAGPLVLLIFAFVYYGQYYRSDLNLGGEGGTVAVIAMRIMEGQRPIVDTFLGYNVMWFYPIVWLFEMTGPNYVALRIFFFGLCFLSGLFGFLTVRRVTGLGWFAVGIGLLIMAIPGMQFRNYMGLLPILNGYVILQAFVLEPRRLWARWVWIAVAGLVLGLTFLVRVELGLFFAVIYFGAAVLFPLGVRGEFVRRLPVAAGGLVLVAVCAVALHAPFYWDAERRGFGDAFVQQYSRILGHLRYEGQRQILDRVFPRPERGEVGDAEPKRSGDSPAVAGQPSLSQRGGKLPELMRVGNSAAVPVQPEVAPEGDGTRQRERLSDVFEQKSFYDAAFVLALYLPLLIGGIILVFAGGGLLLAIFTGDGTLKSRAMTCLVTLGAALTLFSQYFFFRPDTPHLSEFMCPFAVAMACACYFAARRAGEGFRTAKRLQAAGCVGFVVLCAAGEGLYFYHSYPKESAGTIAARYKRTSEFRAENGVNVLIKKRHLGWMRGLYEAVMANSEPGEWVITYPYSPTINFMTDRPSYRHNLYVDNATSSPARLLEETVAEMAQHRPAVIVIDNRDINNTEYSRFRNWASSTRDYIRSRYVLVGTFDENEVYVRPDKVGGGLDGGQGDL